MQAAGEEKVIAGNDLFPALSAASVFTGFRAPESYSPVLGKRVSHCSLALREFRQALDFYAVQYRHGVVRLCNGVRAGLQSNSRHL